MYTKLLVTFGISLLICLTNYIAMIYSKLGSTKAILLDSVIDLIFPIISGIAIFNHDFDKILSIIQFGIILLGSFYLIKSRIDGDSEYTDQSFATVLSMIISIILTILCLQITDSIATEHSQVMSVKAINMHFQVDMLSKMLVILISIINKLGFNRRLKRNVTTVLDLTGVGFIVFTTLKNLYLLWRNK